MTATCPVRRAVRQTPRSTRVAPPEEITAVEPQVELPPSHRWDTVQEKPLVADDIVESEEEIVEVEADQSWPQAPTEETDDTSFESEEPLDLNAGELEPLQDTDIQSPDDAAFEHIDDPDLPESK